MKTANSPQSPQSSTSSSKVCVVCGDKSYGLNFNAITCESCKAFFRRNALSKKALVCPFSGTCTVTVITRRFCQKCRLDKCFAVGMNKEHIMSEEEKIKKRTKIEQNRAKKNGRPLDERSTEGVGGGGGSDEPPLKVKREDSNMTISSVSSPDPFPSTSSIYSSPASVADLLSVESPATTIKSEPPEAAFVMPTLASSPTEIVNSIIQAPVPSGQVINELMKTPQDGIAVMEKILNSPKDAIQLISHFIGSPGDALKIISKIMNSPFDALTIFTKFMSSPTDSIEIITKIISSPNDVLQFLQQLMRSPEDGLQIMTKFMNAPAEALRLINSMMNRTKVDSTTGEHSCGSDGQGGGDEGLITISALEDDSIANNGAQLKVILEKVGEHLNDRESPPNLPTSSTVDVESPVSAEDVAEKRATTEDCAIVEIRPAAEENIFGTMMMTANTIIDEIIKESIDNNSMDAIMCDAIQLEYETNGPSMVRSNGRHLNESEQAKLSELIVAHKALYAPVDEDISSLIADDYGLKDNQSNQDPQLLKLINLTAVAIRRLIKMSKRISAFKNMCQEDQVALLKGGCTEMMMLRSVMQYDSDRASWKIPHIQEAMSSLKADVLKLARGTVYEEHERFILTFKPKWRQDENIILIMCAISLFTPDRARTIHSDVIKLEQNSYYYLLRRYLESIYPSGCEAKSTYLRLIQKVRELRKFNEAVISVYLDVNPAEVEPLLREIFDLKH